MTRGILAISTLACAILFPWQFTALLALATSFLEPLVPLAAGLCIDMLYYAPRAELVPIFTMCGAALTVFALFVRSRLSTGSIET
jgi:hypothetical protein